MVFAIAGAAAGSGELLRVKLGAIEETIPQAEGERRWGLLSPGQRHALGPDEAAQKTAFASLLTDETLLAAEAKRLELPKKFSVAEGQRRILARAVIDHATASVGPASAIAYEDVAAYYEAHKSAYVAPERVQVWRILCKTEGEASALLAKVKATLSVQEWFALARDHSADAATKLRGGNLGFIDSTGVSDDAPVSADPGVVEAIRGVRDGAFVERLVPERGSFGIVWRRATLKAVSRSVEDAAPAIRGALWRERATKSEDAAVKKIVANLSTVAHVDALSAIDDRVIQAHEEAKKARR